ncbi:MAG: protein kinase [Lentisphaeria bacterium]|nr:serine/threonine-protein kinase [Lentisphaeria bacterium]NQZ67093.1 protein kinase [Lentisphaeria bacterium]
MSTNDEIPLSTVIGKLNNPQLNVDDAVKRISILLKRRKSGGRYDIRSELAHGGMGYIHTAFDQDLRRISAMKVISPHLVNEDQKLLSFIEEARLTAHLEHPNIVPVHEIGLIENYGTPYYTMKLVEGEALHEIILKISKSEKGYQDTYNRHKLLDIFRKVCDAVAYAHSRDVIHRDIKPENIMIGQFGEVLLMDWGLAKYTGVRETSTAGDSSQNIFSGLRDAELDYKNTMDGVIKGSLAYISPEQAFGDLSQIDNQSDIFLLGSTLYHMLTLSPPYFGKDINAVLDRAEKCDYMAPSQKNPAAQIPLALERIILKAMSPLKKHRYASVNDLLSDLDAFISGKRVCGRKLFSPGQKIIQFGDVSRETYIIISGKVDVTRMVGDKEFKVAELGHGEIIGEMAGITYQARSATVTALDATEVLIITQELMMEELEKLPPWMEKIVFSLADRVRIMGGHIHPLMLKNRAFPIMSQLYYIFRAKQDSENNGIYSIDNLIEEVTMNLGIDRNSVRKVIHTLIGHQMLSEKKNIIDMTNVKDFGLFVEYCRYKFDIKGGVLNIEELKMTPDLVSFFRHVLRSLRENKDTQTNISLIDTKGSMFLDDDN